jgi:methionyl aminopeptidase
MGKREVVLLEDQWTVVTEDRQPAAHFEHTVAVTETGCEILTTGSTNGALVAGSV